MGTERGAEGRLRPASSGTDAAPQSVWRVLHSPEQGFSFQSLNPKYYNKDPSYRPIRKRPSRFTHLYFYIRDEVLGPMVMCVGTFLPFQTTYYSQWPSLHRGRTQ